MYPGDADTGEQLVVHATSAMNEARRSGEPFLLCNEPLHRRAVERLRLERDMASAFGDGEFELYYQPIVDAQRRTVGAEALIRWHHPTKGVLAPNQFIPIAEQSSIILAVGKWALYAVCRQAQRWCERYQLFLTVNVSAREFERDDLLDTISGAVRNAEGLDPR